MKNIKVYILSLIFTGLLSIHSFGQRPMSLYYMETIPQLNSINPAMQPRTNGYFALPSVSFVFQNDLALRTILQNKGNSWYMPVEVQFDIDKFYKQIGKSYDLMNDMQIDLLGFGWKMGKTGYFTVTVSERIEMNLGMPLDFFKLAEKLLPDGTYLDFSPIRLKALVYKQINFGYSNAISNNLTLGFNLRPLFGQAAVLTDIKKFDINTQRKVWNVETYGNVYTSGPLILKEKPKDPENDSKFKNYPEYEYIDENDMNGYVKRYGMDFSNPGVAVDIGAVYKLDDDWSFSASVNNLGIIMWKNDLNSISFNGKYNFEGKEVDGLNADAYKNLLDDFMKSIEDSVNYSTGIKDFNTTLLPYLYLGASYKLTNTISLGFLSRTIFQNGGVRQNFNLSGNMLLYNYLSLSLSINQQLKGGTYGGFGLAFDLGPVQLYLLSDFIPLRYSTVVVKTYDGDKVKEENFEYIPSRFKEASIMVGLNILFGKKGYKDSPMYERNSNSLF